jgi:uncharacterized membrane protein
LALPECDLCHVQCGTIRTEPAIGHKKAAYSIQAHPEGICEVLPQNQSLVAFVYLEMTAFLSKQINRINHCQIWGPFLDFFSTKLGTAVYDYEHGKIT